MNHGWSGMAFQIIIVVQRSTLKLKGNFYELNFTIKMEEHLNDVKPKTKLVFYLTNCKRDSFLYSKRIGLKWV